jgi:Flp pilus assembly protein TadD
MSGNINAGWEHADSNAAKALTYFNKALAVSSSNAEANLGMGYIYKEQGNAAKAKPYLCKAAKSPDASIQGDAILFLTALKLTCP